MVLKICRIFSYKSFLLQSLYNHQMSRHISECPQESRHRHPHPSIFFCPVTVCIDIWLRLSSYKQLVFHIYIHRFNILKIVTFNKLPCFVQPKSSNASVFCFLFETAVEINTWLLSFHQMHHTSLSSSSPQISLLSEKNSSHLHICYVITINRAIGCQSCRSAVSRNIVFCSWHPQSISLKSNECSVFSISSQ